MVTARSSFVHRALPAYIDFMASQLQRVTGDGLDINKFVAVADALLNMPDYLTRESPPNPHLSMYSTEREYRESFWPKSREYEMVCDIANSHKHRFVSRQGRKINSIEDVRESYALCRYRDSDGEYYRATKAVVVHASDGLKYDARRLLTASMRLWAVELFRLGVVPKTPERIFQYSEFIARDDEAYTKPLRLLGTVGEYFNFEPIILEFSDSEGRLIHGIAASGFDGKAYIDIEVRPSPFDA